MTASLAIRKSLEGGVGDVQIGRGDGRGDAVQAGGGEDGAQVGLLPHEHEMAVVGEGVGGQAGGEAGGEVGRHCPNTILYFNKK